jgi:predicted transcriptional regulator
MSRRDRVRELVRIGWSDTHIAQEVGISVQTVYAYLGDLYDEAGLGGRPRGEWQFRRGDKVGRRGALREWLNGGFDE